MKNKKTAAKARIETLRKTNVELILSLKPADREKLNASAVDATKTDAKANDKNAGDIAAVAQVVQHIVDGVISNDDFLQLCIIKYGYLDKISPEEKEAEERVKKAAEDMPQPPRSFIEACLRRMRIENDKFDHENRKLEYENAATAKYVESVIQDSTLTHKQKRDALLIVVTSRTR
jgi:hypothetical protein